MVTIYARNCNFLWGKIKGLLGAKKPETIYFETRWGIHTFGMSYSIDIVVLDNKSKVMFVKHSLQPNNIYIWNPVYYRILELPSGFCQKQQIRIGKTIRLLLH